MKVNFLGDIGLFRKFEVVNIDPFLEISLPGADFSIGNFEFMVPENRQPFFYDVRENYSCSPAYLRSLSMSSFRGMSLANNHCLDYGPEGLKYTARLLEEHGITVFGYSPRPGYHTAAFTEGDVSLGVIGFVKHGRWNREKHGFGPDPYDPEEICRTVRAMKETFHHVIVFPHWGTELVEIPNQADVVAARSFIDAGASAVIGHHPHICQGIEEYGGGVIAYSLGSFIYIPEEELGYSKKDLNRDISICLTVDLAKDKRITYKASYYRYNPETLVPRPIAREEVRDYAGFLNRNIENSSLYRKQLKAVLLRREIRSFFQRFKEKPLVTMYNYAGLLNPKKVIKHFSS